MKDHGWQQAALAIYPFKVNLLRINDGDFVYIDQDPKRPLHVAHLQFRANNIRNIHSRNRVYPSPVHAEGVIFESGHGVVDGHADFLAEPFAGIHLLYKVSSVPLDNLRPITARANLTLKGGVLESDGEVEYAPEAKFVRVQELMVSGLHLDYVHTLATASGRPDPCQRGRAGDCAGSAPRRVLQCASREPPSPPSPRCDRLQEAHGSIVLVVTARNIEEETYRRALPDSGSFPD